MLSSELRRRTLLKKPHTPCLFLNRIANESDITGLVPRPYVLENRSAKKIKENVTVLWLQNQPPIL